MLLLIHYLLLLPLFVWLICLVLVSVLSVLSSFCNHLLRKKGLVALNLIVFLLSCNCYCSLSYPHGAMNWSAVCTYSIYYAP